jgi:hypothetical protein
MVVINCDPESQGFDIHIHMLSSTTTRSHTTTHSIQDASIDQTTLALLEYVLKRLAGLLYQTIYTSHSIDNIDSIALELYTGHIPQTNLPRCPSTASQPSSAV